jgi:hypothetical protein
MQPTSRQCAVPYDNAQSVSFKTRVLSLTGSAKKVPCAKQSDQAYQYQIDGDDEIQQARNDQYQDAGH